MPYFVSISSVFLFRRHLEWSLMGACEWWEYLHPHLHESPSSHLRSHCSDCLSFPPSPALALSFAFFAFHRSFSWDSQEEAVKLFPDPRLPEFAGLNRSVTPNLRQLACKTGTTIVMVTPHWRDIPRVTETPPKKIRLFSPLPCLPLSPSPLTFSILLPGCHVPLGFLWP